MARSNRSRRESDRAAKARRTTRRGRPNRVRRSPLSLRLKHRAGRPRRQQDGAACSDPVVPGDQSARSLAYPARSHGVQLLREHATDGATNTMIRENRDTAPPGGPAPLSAMCIWMPFVSTMRCFISLTVVPRWLASGRLRLIYVRVCIERCYGFDDEVGNFIGLRHHGQVTTARVSVVANFS